MIKETLTALCGADAIGGSGQAADRIFDLASRLAPTVRMENGGILSTVKGATDQTVLIEAHYDQIGLVVTEVMEGGFLRVAEVGGVDSRVLPASRVKVYGKEVLKATVTSVPPHLKKGKSAEIQTESLLVDTGLLTGVETLVSVGDFVVLDTPLVPHGQEGFCGASLDDRAGCAVLLTVLENLKEVTPAVTVKVLFTDAEELGHRGAVKSGYEVEADTVISVDVTFGDTAGIDPTETGRMGGGAMIGISPFLDPPVYEKLKEIARNTADWQVEIMGGKTGTNADTLGIQKGGRQTGLISVPIRNMHTGAETVKVADIESAAAILTGFVKGE